MSYLSGFPSSYWKESTPATSFPPLDQDAKHDVVIIGAGIAGLVTAMQLTERGYDVAVIEAGDVAAGTTGYTTAKVSSQHGLIYDTLIKTVGEESARLYYEANEEAITFLRHQVERLDIGCELETQDAYLYAATSKEQAMEREVKAYERLGLNGGESSTKGVPYTNGHVPYRSSRTGRQLSSLRTVTGSRRRRSSSRPIFRFMTSKACTSQNLKSIARISYRVWSMRRFRTGCS